jgi:hypothetical protein
MRSRIVLAAAALGALACASPARAQVASIAPPPGAPSGWTFSLAPYAWLPTLSTTYSYTGPRGANVTTNISAGIAYKAASWVDLSAGYRYLAFEDGGRNGIQKLDLGGAIIAADFRF